VENEAISGTSNFPVEFIIIRACRWTWLLVSGVLSVFCGGVDMSDVNRGDTG